MDSEDRFPLYVIGAFFGGITLLFITASVGQHFVNKSKNQAMVDCLRTGRPTADCLAVVK